MMGEHVMIPLDLGIRWCLSYLKILLPNCPICQSFPPAAPLRPHRLPTRAESLRKQFCVQHLISYCRDTSGTKCLRKTHLPQLRSETGFTKVVLHLGSPLTVACGTRRHTRRNNTLFHHCHHPNEVVDATFDFPSPSMWKLWGDPSGKPRTGNNRTHSLEFPTIGPTANSQRKNTQRKAHSTLMYTFA